jgi:hypothetical protein
LVGCSGVTRRDRFETLRHRTGSLNLYHLEMQDVSIAAMGRLDEQYRKGGAGTLVERSSWPQ